MASSSPAQSKADFSSIPVSQTDESKSVKDTVEDAGVRAVTVDAASLSRGEDILELQDLDPALNLKMHLVNDVSGSCRVGYPDADTCTLVVVSR